VNFADADKGGGRIERGEDPSARRPMNSLVAPSPTAEGRGRKARLKAKLSSFKAPARIPGWAVDEPPRTPPAGSS
jgi:hypothetical protein